MPHCLSLKALISKQQLKVKSSIVDTNNHLNGIFSSFDSLHKELSPSFRLVDSFSDHFYFHTVNHKDKKSKEAYLHKLNKIFEDILSDSNTIIVISDTSIKNNVTISILHVCSGYNTIAKTIHHTVNITSTEAELFTIRYGINQAVQVSNISCIIVITNAIHLARWIFDSSSHPYQLQSITIAQDLRAFSNKNSQKFIDFWNCLSNAK